MDLDQHLRETTENDVLRADGGLLISMLSGCDLVPRGSQWWGRCPIHGENTASLNIRERNDRWTWKCFGCGKHGDVIDLLQIMEGIGFREARKRLIARQAGGGYLAKVAKVKRRLKRLRAQEPPPTHYLTCAMPGGYNAKCLRTLLTRWLDVLVLADAGRVAWTSDGVRWVCFPCETKLLREKRLHEVMPRSLI